MNNFYSCGCVSSSTKGITTSVIFCEAHRQLTAVQDALSISTTVMEKVADKSQSILTPLPQPKRTYNNYLR